MAGPGRKSVCRGRRKPAGDGHRQGAWQSLDVADGLPDGMVTAIFQDQDGYLWLGTIDGLSRYDGEAFTTFNAPAGTWSNWVQAIAQDRQGDLWIGTFAGLRRFDGQAFTSYTADDGLPEDGHPGNRVTSLLVDREGALWFGTEAGVCRFDGESFTTFTQEDGLVDDHVEAIAEDSQGNLWFGSPTGASRFDGEHFENLTPDDGLAVPVSSIIEGQNGEIWFGTWGAGVCRFDGEQFTVYTEQDGLAHDRVYAMAKTRQGDLWFGTRRGVSRFDGQSWVTFTAEDGLAYGAVQSVLEDRSGDLWFGTGWEERWRYGSGKGVSRFPGDEVVTFTTDDGLATNGVESMAVDRQGNVWLGGPDGVSWYDGEQFHTLEGPRGISWKSIVEDHQGQVWFGTWRDGVYRYDGSTLDHLTATDGLASNRVGSMFVDRKGQLWIGFGEAAGVGRYDGEAFVTYGATSGLSEASITAIGEDQSGDLWIGTWEGVVRLSGEEAVTYTVDDGLGCDIAASLLGDSQGNMWLGLDGGGVSRYDGDAFIRYSTLDGLTHNYVVHIMEDRRGHFWFGTEGGGVSRFDGRVFQTLLTSDGLISNHINHIVQDRHGDIWIGTDRGVVRYRPGISPPPVRITNVVADRAHGPIAEIHISASQDHLAFEFLGISFRTRPDQMVYLYRLKGHDADWRQTRERRVTYEDVPVGEYVFQVQAVDRDLNYSEEPVEVKVSVHLPYGLVALVVGLGLALIGLVAVGGYGVRRRRERDRAREELLREQEEELQTAHDMQMSLMPTEPPSIRGLSLSGRCTSANHVGGDFYQYYGKDGDITVSLADVTGHAMEAAIPAVMFSGILDKQMEFASGLEERFASLNKSLCRSLGEHTYVCLSMVEIDPEARTIHMANCGCPYPVHYHAATGEVSEWRIDAYPLGVRQDTAYKAEEGTVEPGDYLMLYSDGFPEAANADGDMFGFEHTADVIRQGCSEGLSPEELVERLIGEARAFTGDEPQADDMTCVVVRVEA